MFIVSGIVGGLLGGSFCAFVVAFIATASFMPGWFNHLILPTFYITGLTIGLYLGLKIYPR